jgi:hypothetical protein
MYCVPWGIALPHNKLDTKIKINKSQSCGLKEFSMIS